MQVFFHLGAGRSSLSFGLAQVLAITHGHSTIINVNTRHRRSSELVRYVIVAVVSISANGGRTPYVAVTQAFS